MNNRISAGAIVVKDGKILLVRHRKEGAFDFLVAPGGGVKEKEDAAAAAVREAREETGISVRAKGLAYVEELSCPTHRICKLWFWCEYADGVIDATAPEALAEDICEAGFFSKDEVFRAKTVLPPVLRRESFWTAAANGMHVVEYLGLREMEFY